MTYKDKGSYESSPPCTYALYVDGSTKSVRRDLFEAKRDMVKETYIKYIYTETPVTETYIYIYTHTHRKNCNRNLIKQILVCFMGLYIM